MIASALNMASTLSLANIRRGVSPFFGPSATSVVLLFIVLIFVTPAHAQGCAQCLDSTRATPPAVQAAYRHAIYLLIAAASTIFLVGLYLLRRNP